MDAGRGSSAVIFPVPQVPALALLFPPPPPGALPSSSLSLSSYSSSSSRHAPSITSFPILVLTVLGILAACVLLLAYYVFVIRCCLTWHRDRGASDAVSRRPQRTRTRTSGSTPASSAEPRGLEDAAIRALPVFSYRKKPAAGAESPPSAPASECAVCLGEFEDGDRVRMLPACLHVFHVGCVDAWLQGNASCPLCRARADVDAARCCLLLPTPPPPPPPEEEVVVAAIQVVVVVPGAEEDDRRGTLPQRQREAIVASAAAEVMTERRKDGDVVAPRTRRSFSTDGDAVAGGGEVQPQIQSILQSDGRQ